MPEPWVSVDDVARHLGVMTEKLDLIARGETVAAFETKRRRQDGAT